MFEISSGGNIVEGGMYEDEVRFVFDVEDGVFELPSLFLEQAEFL